MLIIQASENSTVRTGFNRTVQIMGLINTAAIVMYSIELKKMSVSYITQYSDLNSLLESELKTYFKEVKPSCFLLCHESTKSGWEAIFEDELMAYKHEINCQPARRLPKHRYAGTLHVAISYSDQEILTLVISDYEAVSEYQGQIRELYSIDSSHRMLPYHMNAFSDPSSYIDMIHQLFQIQLYLSRLNGACRIISAPPGAKQTTPQIIFDNNRHITPKKLFDLSSYTVKILEKLYDDLGNLDRRVSRHESKPFILIGELNKEDIKILENIILSSLDKSIREEMLRPQKHVIKYVLPRLKACLDKYFQDYRRLSKDTYEPQVCRMIKSYSPESIRWFTMSQHSGSLTLVGKIDNKKEKLSVNSAFLMHLALYGSKFPGDYFVIQNINEVVASYPLLCKLSNEEYNKNKKTLANCIEQLLNRLPPNNNFQLQKIPRNRRDLFSQLKPKTSFINKIKAYSCSDINVPTFIIYCSFSSTLARQLFLLFLSNRNIPNTKKQNEKKDEFICLFSVSLRRYITNRLSLERSVSNINNLLESFVGIPNAT